MTIIERVRDYFGGDWDVLHELPGSDDRFDELVSRLMDQGWNHWEQQSGASFRSITLLREDELYQLTLCYPDAIAREREARLYA